MCEKMDKNKNLGCGIFIDLNYTYFHSLVHFQQLICIISTFFSSLLIIWSTFIAEENVLTLTLTSFIVKSCENLAAGNNFYTRTEFKIDGKIGKKQ